jgi:hypothetical protein
VAKSFNLSLIFSPELFFYLSTDVEEFNWRGCEDLGQRDTDVFERRGVGKVMEIQLKRRG